MRTARLSPQFTPLKTPISRIPLEMPTSPTRNPQVVAKMKRTVIPPQLLLDVEAVKLGRLVTSIKRPNQDFHDPPPPPPTSSPTSSTDQNQQIDLPSQHFITVREAYALEHTTTHKIGFAASLTSLLSTGFTRATKSKTQITADSIKTYTLANSDDWFEQATQRPASRAWIERSIDRGRDIYLIVGFHTLTDARIRQEYAAGGSSRGKIVLPIGMSVPVTAGLVMPLPLSLGNGNGPEPALAVDGMGAEEAVERGVFRGEQVCALEYRRVRHRWLSSREDLVDGSTLSSKVCYWSSVEQMRDDEGEEDEDVLSVELGDLEGLDGGEWERESVDGGDDSGGEIYLAV